jgi:hypothetical protein
MRIVIDITDKELFITAVYALLGLIVLVYWSALDVFIGRCARGEPVV